MIFRPEFLAPLVPLVPGAVALGAGVARRRELGRPGVALDLLPPEGAEVDLNAWLHLFQSLYGISRPWWKRCFIGQPWLGLELRAKDGLVWARCWCPEPIEGLVSAHLRETVPGVQVREADEDNIGAAPAARTRLKLALEPLHSLGATKPDAMSRITGLLSGTQDAWVQVVISPDVTWQRQARRRLEQLAGADSMGSMPLRLLSGLFGEVFGIFWPSGGGEVPPKRSTSTQGRGARVTGADKAAMPGWAAEIRLRVAANTQAEANLHMQSLVSAFRALDGANALRPARVLLGSRFDRDLVVRRPPRSHGMVLVAPELTCLFHLPCAGSALTTAAVRVAAARAIGTGDKVICLPEDGTGPPMGIRQADCRQHIHILGPTGSGKSTLLLNLALDDILAGRGVGVIDPKGDLIQALLERIPQPEWERVVLIDPAQRELPVGLNVLACDDPDLREVVCDQVVTIFHRSFERFWGPRTDDLLRAAILTLLEKPGTTLCEVPLLLLQPEMRQKFIADLDDPVGLEPFWKEFGSMTEGQRLQVIGPLLNKLRTFLLRRTVRNMLGQSRSTIGVSELLDNNCIVLISLAKGLLGEETSQLLGAFLFARIWQATLARGGRPESWRPDFNLYVDEFQNYLHLPQSIEDVLAEARGYHLGLVLANQHVAQLGASAREALAANARTRVSFQCGQDDARYLAREFGPQLGERELRGLRQFQVAVRLCVNGRTEPAFTGVTRGVPPSLGEENAACLTRHALQRWGRPRPVVEAEIRSRLDAEGFSNPDEGLGD